MGAIPTGGSNGLLRVISNADMVKQEQADAAAAAEAQNNTPLVQGLAAHVTKCWEAARDAKTEITERLLKAQRARFGQYSPEELAFIRELGGSEEYARISANKCRIADSWLYDVYLGQTDAPWTLNATPSPELDPTAMEQVKTQVGTEAAQYYAVTGQMPSPEVVQQRVGQLTDAEFMRIEEEARRIIKRMQRKMEDQLEEGGWHEQWGEFLNDVVTYPAAHFKAPVIRKRKELKWVDVGGVWQPQVQDVAAPEFERVDPFRAFPSPGATSPQHGFFIEWLTYSRDDLYNLIGLPGFKEEAIRAVLEEYGSGGLKDWLGLTTRTELEDINGISTVVDSPEADIDCLEFHGRVRGRDLLDWGLEADKVPDADRDYEANVWMIGRWVIKAQLNPDPLNRRPYYKASYEEVPGSYWGMGLIDLLDDVQGVANATMRSLVNNMALASGPQVGVNVSLLPPGEDITNIYPWKIWQYQSDMSAGNSGKPVEFFQPSSNAQELLMVMEKMYQFADDWSLIPRYMAGSEKMSGAGRTASGMSMLMNAANKGLKGVVSNIDAKVLTPMLQNLYNFNMIYDPDPSIKGDAKVSARGATSLMQLESLQLRRNEFLAATANPIDSQIVGVSGRAEVLREVAKGLEMDVNRVVPPREAFAQVQPQMPGQMPQGPQAQLTSQQNQEVLQNGQAVTDNFSPNKMRSAV